MVVSELHNLFGYDADAGAWVELDGIHDPGARTFTVVGEGKLYDLYAMGATYDFPGVPTTSEWGAMLLIIGMGMMLLVVRRTTNVQRNGSLG